MCVQKCNSISLMGRRLQIIRDGRVFLFLEGDRVGGVSLVLIFDMGLKGGGQADTPSL